MRNNSSRHKLANKLLENFVVCHPLIKTNNVTKIDFSNGVQSQITTWPSLSLVNNLQKFAWLKSSQNSRSSLRSDLEDRTTSLDGGTLKNFLGKVEPMREKLRLFTLGNSWSPSRLQRNRRLLLSRANRSTTTFRLSNDLSYFRW